MHLTLGILRTSQAVFYALSFSQLDGFAVPAPAQVTQTVRRWCKTVSGILQKTVFLVSIFLTFLVSCTFLERDETQSNSTAKDVSSVMLTQLAKPIATSTVGYIPRESYDFLPNPTATQEIRSREIEETNIYLLFLNDFCEKQYFVLNEASYIENENTLNTIPPSFEQTRDDYQNNNQTKILDASIIPKDGQCELISSDEVTEKIENQNNVNVLVKFSTIGFNGNLDQAFLFVGYYCGKSCEGNTGYILVRDGNVWKIESWLPGYLT